MKDSRFQPRRIVLVALMAVAATAALAQDGPPPGGQRGPGGFRGGRGGRMGGPQRLDRLPPLAQLATRPEVAAEIGLSEDQRAQIDEIAQSMRPPRPQDGQDGPPDFRAMETARDRAEAAADAKVKALLSAAQAKRLAEIQVQAMGLSAAMVPEVQAKLGLSADQKAQLKALVPQGGPGGRGFGGPGGPPQGGPGGDQGGPPPGGPGGPGGFDGPPQGGPGGRGPGGPNDGRRRELETKIAAILTDSQKASLKALGGKPLAMRPPQGPPPGGPDGGPGDN